MRKNCESAIWIIIKCQVSNIVWRLCGVWTTGLICASWLNSNFRVYSLLYLALSHWILLGDNTSSFCCKLFKVQNATGVKCRNSMQYSWHYKTISSWNDKNVSKDNSLHVKIPECYFWTKIWGPYLSKSRQAIWSDFSSV